MSYSPDRRTPSAPWVIPTPGYWGDPPQFPYTYTIKTLRACNCMGKCFECGRCACVCTCKKEPRPLRAEDV